MVQPVKGTSKSNCPSATTTLWKECSCLCTRLKCKVKPPNCLGNADRAAAYSTAGIGATNPSGEGSVMWECGQEGEWWEAEPWTTSVMKLHLLDINTQNRWDFHPLLPEKKVQKSEWHHWRWTVLSGRSKPFPLVRNFEGMWKLGSVILYIWVKSMLSTEPTYSTWRGLQLKLPKCRYPAFMLGPNVSWAALGYHWRGLP